MRILLVTQRFRPLIGGAESVLGEMARELVRQRHEVTVLTAKWENGWLDEEQVDDVRIVRVPQPTLRFWGTSRFMRLMKQWLLKHGREFNVWYVSMLKHCAWVAIGAGWRLRLPVVLRPEGSGATGDVAWQDRAWFGRLIRRRCRLAAAVVALSSHIREELRLVGFSADRIRDIPNGVRVPELGDDLDRLAWRQRLGLEPTAPHAVFVGRLSPEKGLDVLFKAWRRVTAELPDARLVVVGSGPQEAELRKLASDQPTIIWAGETREPSRFLRAADLFVLPSHEEGMSIALLEAMAHALPIVATDIPGNRQLIESGRHGLLVPSNKPETLARSVLVQLQARTLAAAMGRAARERAEEKYSISLMVRRHVELFESLASPNKESKQD